MTVRDLQRYRLIALATLVLSGLHGATITIAVTTNFPSPDGAPINYAGINDNGDVVFATASNNSYLRRADGTVVPIAFPGGSGTSARGINNAGEIVGLYYLGTSGRPFVRQPNGGYLDLGTMMVPFDNRQVPLLTADALNNGGEILGEADGAGIVDTLNFIRDSGGNVTVFGYGELSYASGINDFGQVVGFYEGGTSPNSFVKAFLRTADSTVSTLDALDFFPAPPCGFACPSVPFSLLKLNNAGDVLAGSAVVAPAGYCCSYYLLHRDNSLEGLIVPVLSGGNSNLLLGLNNNGQVVGFSNSTAGNQGFIGTYVSGRAPAIQTGGIVPLYSTTSTVQPGEWVSLFGSDLASAAATWNGDFPPSLGGTSVTVDGKAAYLWYVSPGQINFQVPDDTRTGPVPVMVTTTGGTAASTVTLAAVAPSFSLLDTRHVAGIIVRADGSGAYDGGTYDILGPSGTSLGYRTMAAKAGDVIELFGVGFGPTAPVVPAGRSFSGSAPAINPVGILINNVSVTPSFVGLISAGLYQINLTLPPGLGSGDLSLIAKGGGVQTPSTVVISVQ